MNTYIVEATQTIVYQIEVEADNIADAVARVDDMNDPVELPTPTDAFDFTIRSVTFKSE